MLKPRRKEPMKSLPNTPVIQSQTRRGRPRVDQPWSMVSTRLPVGYHDRLIELSNQREMSVSAFVRQILILRLEK